MKVFVIIPSMHRGGAERVASILTNEWSKEHEVTLVVFDSSKQAYSFGGSLIDLDLSAGSYLLQKCIRVIQRIKRLSRLFRMEKPDRIISFMESANFPTIFAALIANQLSKVWVSVHNDPARFSKIYRLLIPFLYHLPDKVVTVSSGIAHALALRKVSKSKLLIIPNPPPIQVPEINTFLSRPIDAPARYILGVGRLHWQKGFDRLINAFSMITDEPDLYLVILGEGKERTALERQAMMLGVTDRVLMPGAVKDVWSWYRYAQCFALSSRHEGWPNVIMEALSQACPVVAFNCQYGPNEIIENGYNGYLLPEGNISDLADYIKNKKLLNGIRNKMLVDKGTIFSEKNISDIIQKWMS
ncbi:MAG: glycosyltransferase [Enterobacteriaceae bacterium]